MGMSASPSAATPSSESTAPSAALIRQAERFLDHLAVERGAAPNTVAAYRRDLRLYLAHLASRHIRSVAEVQEIDISAFLGGLREREYAPARRYSSASVARMLA